MNAARGDTDQHITHLDLRAVDELLLLYDTHREAGNIVLAFGVHARHLGRLATNECATCLTATLGHTGYDLLDLGRLVATHGHIVQEQQRFGALCQDIVYAHGHGIDTDRIVLVNGKGQFEFRTHAIRTAHQDGLLDLQGREVEHTAKGTDVTHHAQTIR